MERLTFTDAEMKEFGENFDCPVKNNPDDDYDFVAELCDRVCDMFVGRDCPYMNMGKKLKSYEDAEEQGLLLRLPCKVGDTIYQVNSSIDTFIVTAIGIYPGKVVICTENYENGIGYSFDAKRIGKRYFLTKEEAEQTLAEMKGV